MWYLNTIQIKDNGYTEFVDGTKIQPKAGTLIRETMKNQLFTIKIF